MISKMQEMNVYKELVDVVGWDLLEHVITYQIKDNTILYWNKRLLLKIQEAKANIMSIINQKKW